MLKGKQGIIWHRSTNKLSAINRLQQRKIYLSRKFSFHRYIIIFVFQENKINAHKNKERESVENFLKLVLSEVLFLHIKIKKINRNGSLHRKSAMFRHQNAGNVAFGRSMYSYIAAPGACCCCCCEEREIDIVLAGHSPSFLPHPGPIQLLPVILV